MRIVVCVKPAGGEINPFDESALEYALQIDNAQIIVLSMGPPSAKDQLKRLTRLGISRAILLADPAFAGADTLATAYTLSLAIKKLSPDLIICGRQSTDGDTAQTGPSLAQMLRLPQVTNVLKIKSIDSEISCLSRTGEEEAMLPALITVERNLVLRFPSIRSKPRLVEEWDRNDINADINKCGLRGSPTRVLKTYECNIGKRECKLIKAEDLIEIIERERGKLKTAPEWPQSRHKLEEIWVIGDELKEIGYSVANCVRVLTKQEPGQIGKLAEELKPKAILWTGDLWGRNIAHRVAAMLQTGLCAD